MEQSTCRQAEKVSYVFQKVFIYGCSQYLWDRYCTGCLLKGKYNFSWFCLAKNQIQMSPSWGWFSSRLVELSYCVKGVPLWTNFTDSGFILNLHPNLLSTVCWLLLGICLQFPCSLWTFISLKKYSSHSYLWCICRTCHKVLVVERSHFGRKGVIGPPFGNSKCLMVAEKGRRRRSKEHAKHWSLHYCS